MKEVRLVKAGQIGGQEVEDTVIRIADEIPEFQYKAQGMEDIENYYIGQADKLVGALFESLPQGTLDRVLIALMKRKVSLYKGKTES